MVSDVMKILKHETPTIFVHWRPDFGTYTVNLWTHVGAADALPPTAPPFRANGRGAYLDVVDDQVAGAISKLMAAWEGDTEEELATADVLNAEICSFGVAMAKGPYFKDGLDGTPIEHATIPTTHAVVLPECSPKCSYQHQHMGTAYEDMEFAAELSQLEDWVQDVKAIYRAEHEEVQIRLDERYGKGKVRRCMPPGAINLRFGQASKSLLTLNAGTEDVVYLQWSFLTSTKIDSGKPRKQWAIQETIEQLNLCKYKARPHWGKNEERVFRHPECHVRDNFPATSFPQLLELQQLHDPQKVFEPELFNHVLQKSGPDYSELCALRYWCYCREDMHCPQGFSCQPSPAFPEYNTCRLASHVYSEL